MDTPTVSVVVPVYNGAASIEACVRSLVRLDYPGDRIELIVVDNASTDHTRVVLDRYRPRIRLLEESVRGPSAARNTGIRHATGECIAFTDADCVVEPDWLRHLLPPLARPTVGIAGGEILALRPCNRIELFGEKVHDHRCAIEQFVPPSAFAMNWASRRAVLEEVGCFDETLPRGEDVDLAYRIHAAGYSVVYCCEARVYHRHPSTFGALLAKGFLHGQARVLVLTKAAPLALAPPRRRFSTERRLLRSSRRWLTGPDRFDALCGVAFDLGKAVGELATLVALRRT